MRYSFKSTDRSLQRTPSKPTRETFMAGNGKRVYIEHVAPKHRIPVIAELFKDIDLQKCNKFMFYDCCPSSSWRTTKTVDSISLWST